MSKLWFGLHSEIVVFPDQCACTDPGGAGGGGGPGPSATSFFSHQLNFRFFSKKTIISKTPGGSNIFRGGPTFHGGGGGPSIRIQITCDFPGSGFGPLSPSGSSHENSLFRCSADGLKMCMSCVLDIIVKLFFL